jgi:hypothetical protein
MFTSVLDLELMHKPDLDCDGLAGTASIVCFHRVVTNHVGGLASALIDCIAQGYCSWWIRPRGWPIMSQASDGTHTHTLTSKAFGQLAEVETS